MKKLILICMFFLTCCAPLAPAKPTPTSGPTLYPNMDVFTTGEQCPNVCWLGIHPGTTTRQEAIDIFTKAPEQLEMRVLAGSLEGEWVTDKDKRSQGFVSIRFAGDVVDTIMLGRLLPFKTSDFVSLLGEPSKMWIFWTDDRVGYGFKRTRYGLYYPEQKIEVQAGYSGIDADDWGGPNPESEIEWVKLNVQPQYGEAHLQPWLGYGHLEEYRPKAVPTPAQ